MTSPAMIRPPRVTTACLFIGVSCVMLLLQSSSALSSWGSTDVQEMVKNLGVDPQVADDWHRPVLLGVSALATAGLVLAIYTAKGHEASRLVLSFLAIVIGASFVLFQTGFAVITVGVSLFCVTYLWSAEARYWFAVKNGKTPPVIPVAPPKPTREPKVTRDEPAPPAEEQPYAQTYGSPQATATLQAPAPAAPKSRPDNVLIASLIALIMSSLVVIVCGFNAAAYLVSRDEYISLLEDNPMMKDAIAEVGMSIASLARLIFIVCGIAAALSLAAVAAAGATLAGRPEGRIALVILSFLTVPISFAAFPVGLVWGAAAIATLVLLRKPDARSWFARS